MLVQGEAFTHDCPLASLTVDGARSLRPGDVSGHGGGESPADLAAGAPVSTSDRPATPGGDPGGESAFSSAEIPTIAPTAGIEWQDNLIANWLESHAAGYEHAKQPDVAYALREKAAAVRRREYLP